MGERKGPSEGLNLQREVEKEELCITERGLYREGEGLGWRGERVYAQKRQKGKWANNLEVREKGRRRGRGTEKRQGEEERRQGERGRQGRRENNGER